MSKGKKQKRKRENEYPPNKRRKIDDSQQLPPPKNEDIFGKIDKLITSISDTNLQPRMHDVFNAIFEFYNHDDMEFIKGNVIYQKLDNIIIEFCDLLMQSNGEFQISDDSIFIFKDKRFFVPMYFLTPLELKIVKFLIDHQKMDPKYRNTKMFETLPEKIKVDIDTRTNLLKCYLKHIAESINSYFPLFFDNNLKEAMFQYKIILSRRMIDVCKHVGSKYSLDLKSSIQGFNEIITSAKTTFFGKIDQEDIEEEEEEGEEEEEVHFEIPSSFEFTDGGNFTIDTIPLGLSIDDDDYVDSSEEQNF